MKKKILALLLCTALTAATMTACGNAGDSASDSGNTEQSPEQTPDATPEPSESGSEPAQAEELPTPKYYFSFDQADGTNGIVPTAKGTGEVIETVEKEVAFIPGVKGEAVYIDGTYGLRLSDVNGVGDTYSLSFWMYANRNANYMPTTQFGPDVHGDATGGQHYLNVTWADWSGSSEFPCIWSYDQNAEGSPWPQWAPETADIHLNQWINITLVVDPSKLSEDGKYITPDLYVNGECVSDAKPVNIITGTMEPSDNFDFLLGVNYWDAMLKGAFDELYIFDTTLTPGQVKTLYEAGDTTVKYEPPERVVEVKVDENALETIGNTDLNAGFWTDWTSAYEIPEGVTKVFKLNNFSSGLETWHNYVMVFANEATEAHADPNANADVHKEFAAIRADAYGWMPGDVNSENTPDKFGFTWTWGNWDSWKTVSMVDVDVTIEVKREGNILNITVHNVDYNGLDNIMTAKVETEIADGDDCYMFLTCEGSYVELLSVEDGVDIKPDSNAKETLGTTTFGLGFWAEATSSVELADGDSKTVKLNNYSSGAENYHNYVVAFANVPTTADKVPSADNYEGYAEYAVVRADIYGWTPTSNSNDGTGEFAFEKSWEDWDAWKDAMRDVDVTMVITRNGAEIVIDTTFVDRKGNEFTSKATLKPATLTADAPCYFFITGEQAYIELMSVE
ncbi:MAG: LamG domain-containing protein [Butyrivibrio sp.]|nr:LamG domain-containing protein [Acetatifactor muris]MCM1558324.1 LamG domain-containing protein [Butyrivibrio sp.]